MNDSNETMVGEDAYFFLQNFFQEHPQYNAGQEYVLSILYYHCATRLICATFFFVRFAFLGGVSLTLAGARVPSGGSCSGIDGGSGSDLTVRGASLRTG